MPLSSRPLLPLLALFSCEPRPGAEPGAEPAPFLRAEMPSSTPRVRGVAPGPALAGRDPSERAASGLAVVGARAGLRPDALSRYHLERIHPLGGGGIAIWSGTADGLPVIGGDVKVVFDAAGSLVGWSVGEAAGLDLPPGPPTLDAVDAADLVTGRAAGSPRAQGAWLVFADGTRARGVAFAADGRLRRAWQVEHRTPDGVWSVTVDALDGAELGRSALTWSHTYGVWADPTDHRPDDSAWEDASPHATGVPGGPLPLEGPQALVTELGANVNGDPWLDPGATLSMGNHAAAYADRAAPSGFGPGDVIGRVSSPGTFDHPFDFETGPLAGDQVQASITQAFYTVNWLHDWYYDSGFDELAGDAQLDNYGRGGAEGDPMLVEVQDAAFDPLQRDNANMTAQADGVSPVMQVYLYRRARVEVVGGSSAEAGTADFGPLEFETTGDLYDTGSTACATVSPAVSGRVALVDRGICSYITKVANAQAAGAIGVVIANTDDAISGMEGVDPAVTIPSVLVAASTAADLRRELSAGPVDLTLARADVDAALDDTVVAHEWGHYLFGRLAGPCLFTECRAANEGNSDVVALLMMLREGDDLDGLYAYGGYAYQAYAPDSTYFGARRIPYSRDPAANALSFRHVGSAEPLPTTHPVVPLGDNAEVHNAGEVWASTVFDAYLGLQEAGAASGRTFAEVERRMADVLVAGLSLVPPEPTFLDLRDALVVSANALDPADAVVVAEAFARRGMGSCAVGPVARSVDLSGVVEDFTTDAVVEVSAPAVDDAGGGCDDDGVLDAGERGTVSVAITNTTVGALSGATLTLAVDPPVTGLSFPMGPTIAVPALGAFGSTTLEIPVELDATGSGPGATFTATLTGPDLCNSGQSAASWLWLESDVASAASATDDFSVDDGSWVPTGAGGSEVWSRLQDPATGVATWVGVDSGGPTDTRLEGPPMEVTGDLVLTLTHRYSFEYLVRRAWDAGVLELSVDGGPWQDVSTWVADPGYTGEVNATAGNPLGGRIAFTGDNPSWPAFDVQTLDFGAALIGHTARLSLRIGTDEANGAPGWELAEVTASGLGALPFPTVGVDVATPGVFHADTDDDTFGDPAAPLTTCVAPADHVGDATDCDDGLAEVNPDATEVCNLLDDDCDDAIDVGAADAATWYADVDGDGFTDPASSTTACEAPAGFAEESASEDCDDGDGDTFPGATDVPGDGVDQDCSGADSPTGGDDTGEGEGEGEGEDEAPRGCGCAATPAPAGALGLLGALGLVARRRRSSGGA